MNVTYHTVFLATFCLFPVAGTPVSVGAVTVILTLATWLGGSLADPIVGEVPPGLQDKFGKTTECIRFGSTCLQLGRLSITHSMITANLNWYCLCLANTRS